MDPVTMFAIAAFVGFAISTAEICAMAVNAIKLRQTVANIKRDAKQGAIEAWKDPEVRSQIVAEIKPLMKEAVDQDMLEAWAATAVLSVTDPNKPYMKEMSKNVFESVKSGIYGMMGADRKEQGALEADLLGQVMEETPMGQLIVGMKQFVKPDSLMGKALADPGKTMQAIGAFQKVLPTLIELGKASGVVNK